MHASNIGRADLHMHTTYSDGASTPAAVLQMAAIRGIDVVAITDHNTIEGALVASTLAEGNASLPRVVVGEEISSEGGHILGLFLKELIEPGKSAGKTIEAIHAQGGLAVAPHPYYRAGIHGVGQRVTTLPFDAWESLNGVPAPGIWLSNRKTKYLALDLNKCQVAGSDAHGALAVGCTQTLFQGKTPIELREAILNGKTHPIRLKIGIKDTFNYLAKSILHHPTLVRQFFRR